MKTTTDYLNYLKHVKKKYILFLILLFSVPLLFISLFCFVIFFNIPIDNYRNYYTNVISIEGSDVGSIKIPKDYILEKEDGFYKIKDKTTNEIIAVEQYDGYYNNKLSYRKWIEYNEDYFLDSKYTSAFYNCLSTSNKYSFVGKYNEYYRVIFDNIILSDTSKSDYTYSISFIFIKAMKSNTVYNISESFKCI